MPKKKDDSSPTGGSKDIDKKLAEGKDPNAELDYEADTKAQAGLTLKLKGASWSDIARVLEYSSPTQARVAVERVLASASNSPDSLEHARVLANKRLERLLLAVMPKALKEDDPNQLAYHARAVAVVDRISKLNGLDAAQQVQVTASDETIQQYVAHMATLAGYSQKAIEGEIIDLGETEGEF